MPGSLTGPCSVTQTRLDAGSCVSVPGGGGVPGSPLRSAPPRPGREPGVPPAVPPLVPVAGRSLRPGRTAPACLSPQAFPTRRSRSESRATSASRTSTGPWCLPPPSSPSCRRGCSMWRPRSASTRYVPRGAAECPRRGPEGAGRRPHAAGPSGSRDPKLLAWASSLRSDRSPEKT